MEIIIKGEPKEIAALVVGLQGRQPAELRDPLEGLESRLVTILKEIGEGHKGIQYL